MQQPPDPHRAATPRKFRSKRRAAESGTDTAPASPKQREDWWIVAARKGPPAEPADEGAPVGTGGEPPARRWKPPAGWLWALPVLVALIALLLVGRSLYRDFQLREAERRHAEAERKELEEHPLPRQYRDLIEEHAAFYELEPSLVAAVILRESSFNPDAVSRLGARGLMQLMPDTAAWIAEKLGEEYTPDRSFDPGTNIRFGCWYLNYLSNRYEGDHTKTISAYHAGPGNVDAWLRNPKYSPDGVTLETIATGGTSEYVGKVLRARQVYQKRYYSDSEAPPSETAADAGADLLPIAPLPTP